MDFREQIKTFKPKTNAIEQHMIKSKEEKKLKEFQVILDRQRRAQKENAVLKKTVIGEEDMNEVESDESDKEEYKQSDAFKKA
jgi:hypothetical protein